MDAEMPSSVKEPEIVQVSAPTKNMTWLYVIIAVLCAVLIAGAVLGMQLFQRKENVSMNEVVPTVTIVTTPSEMNEPTVKPLPTTSTSNSIDAIEQDVSASSLDSLDVSLSDIDKELSQ